MDAGLPNLVGNVYRDRNTEALYWSTGAFYNANNEGGGNGTGGTANAPVAVKMDASRYNSIYGSSTTVTPLTESCKFLIVY